MSSAQESFVIFENEPRGTIASVPEFLSEVLNVRQIESNQKMWYRGHPDVKYELKPTIGRELSYAGKKVRIDRQKEMLLLHRFRRRAYPYVNRILTVGEAIFLARHHGLTTRLLDWTGIPFLRFILHALQIGKKSKVETDAYGLWRAKMKLLK